MPYSPAEGTANYTVSKDLESIFCLTRESTAKVAGLPLVNQGP